MLHGPLSPKRLCRLGSTFSLILLVFCVACVACVAAADVQLDVVETKKIWDRAPHNAFTDLVRWNDRFYCAFREGQGHAGDIGKLRIITSADGDQWGSAGLLALKDYDLRDAALSVTPDNRLMVLGGAQKVADGQRRTGTFVSFSEDGEAFTEPEIVLPLGRWLWRVTWHGDTAYGVSYGTPDNRAESALLKTKDGLNYEVVTDSLLAEGGWPTEARIRFTKYGTAYCLHRRDGEQNSAYLGVAPAPYDKWSWVDLKVRFGGPNFLQIPSGHWIGAGRLYDGGARTELVIIDPAKGTMNPLIKLPSGGDTSYPGLVWHDDQLWVSYYASHEGKTNIYLAKIRFDESAPIEIGNRLEPFVDRHLIHALENAELRLHAPRAAESVLSFDRPWEGAFCGYTTVIKDADRFRMYYRGLPSAGRDGTNREVTCYAESEDGIDWHKPNLGLYEIEGSRQNNVVLAGQTPASHNFSPFLDQNPDAPADQRYKALGGTSAGLIGFVSSDGLRWKRIQSDPVFTQGLFDSQNVSFYSQSEHQYVCYFRTWTGTGYGGFRTVSRTTSKDFIHWTDPVRMSFGDTPLEHLYTNQTTPYFRAPHLYLGVAARFMPGRQVISASEAEQINVNKNYFGDCSDAVLLSSRGGSQYDRTFMESFIRPGLGLQNWVSRTNYPALGIVPTSEDEISIYLQKNYGQPTSHLQRFTLRTDGFASVHTGYNEGEMLTRPLIFGQQENVRLLLNYATSAAGSVIVELQDEEGNPIPGFTLEDCQPRIGDRISAPISWKSGKELGDLAGKPIRVRFVLKDADLFAMQFASYKAK
ncbi:MAG: hypothetical protein P8N76_24270 [Pirellulaceae bacterium]|nr:hypothetical protein [Pirellulaceae bacterium]